MLCALPMRTNQKFADFLVDFNMLSSQVNWGDRALCHRLKQALPDRIKDALVLVEEPAAFNEWKRLVQNIDQRYWERQAEIRRDARPNSGTNTTHATPAPNARNTSAGAPSTSATSTVRDTGSSLPVARHLTAQCNGARGSGPPSTLQRAPMRLPRRSPFVQFFISFLGRTKLI